MNRSFHITGAELLQTAKEHDTQLAVLKKAKEEADANQSRIQREMRDEMERMKTQFIFKVGVSEG